MPIDAKVYDKANCGDPDSPLKGEVVAITVELQPILATDGEPGSVVRRVKGCLEHAHPGEVREREPETVYIYVWNEDHWCLRCVEMGKFELSFPRGTVVVEVEEGRHYAIP